MKRSLQTTDKCQERGPNRDGFISTLLGKSKSKSKSKLHRDHQYPPSSSNITAQQNQNQTQNQNQNDHVIHDDVISLVDRHPQIPNLNLLPMTAEDDGSFLCSETCNNEIDTIQSGNDANTDHHNGRRTTHRRILAATIFFRMQQARQRRKQRRCQRQRQWERQRYRDLDGEKYPRGGSKLGLGTLLRWGCRSGSHRRGTAEAPRDDGVEKRRSVGGIIGRSFRIRRRWEGVVVEEVPMGPQPDGKELRFNTCVVEDDIRFNCPQIIFFNDCHGDDDDITSLEDEDGRDNDDDDDATLNNNHYFTTTDPWENPIYPTTFGQLDLKHLQELSPHTACSEDKLPLDGVSHSPAGLTSETDGTATMPIVRMEQNVVG